MQDVAPLALNHLNILKYTGCPSINYFTEGGLDVLANRGHWPTRHLTGGRSSMEHSDCPSYYPIAVTKG